MSNTKRSRRARRAIGAAALAVALIAAGTTQASAAPKWSPAFTTFTGSGASLQLSSGDGGGYYRCNSSSMTIKTAADGFNATTQPAGGGGVTFSNCEAVGGIAAGLPVSMTMSGQWKITPTSTTAATVELPANSLTVTVGASWYACTITIGPGALNLPANWSGSALKLTGGLVNVQTTGGVCSNWTVRNLYMNTGWNFNGLSILP